MRSLTLDKMKSEWEEKLKEVGNVNSNKIYEEILPVGFSRGTYCTCTTHESVVSIVWVNSYHCVRPCFRQIEKGFI